MIRGLFIVAVLLGSVAIVEAAPAAPCYRPAEIEANEAVRFQTELMVLSDTCRRDSYVRFAQRNGDVIAAYQRDLLQHYRRVSGKSGESAFDRYLTALANEDSLRIGRENLASLCTRQAEFLTKADAIGKGEFRKLAAEQAAARQRDYRHCTK